MVFSSCNLSTHLSTKHPPSCAIKVSLSQCETKTKIECEAYKALMTVWNSSKSEKVLTITNTHSHTLTLKDASEHPISLQNIFQHERIGEHYYYKTFLGQYLSVGKRGHLSIQVLSEKNISESPSNHFNVFSRQTCLLEWPNSCDNDSCQTPVLMSI